MQQQQGPATIVAIPPSADQEMVLTREPPAKKGSKLKGFFTRNKKAKIVLSERDAEILRKVKHRAKVLDTGFNLGFAKIGLDPIIGKVQKGGRGNSVLCILCLPLWVWLSILLWLPSILRAYSLCVTQRLHECFSFSLNRDI